MLDIILADPNSILFALGAHRLQVKNPNGKWYDVRKTGKIKTWKRDLNWLEVPCCVGLKDNFHLCFSGAYSGPRINGDTTCDLRVRPDNFDPRKRT